MDPLSLPRHGEYASFFERKGGKRREFLWVDESGVTLQGVNSYTSRCASVMLPVVLLNVAHLVILPREEVTSEPQTHGLCKIRPRSWFVTQFEFLRIEISDSPAHEAT